MPFDGDLFFVQFEATPRRDRPDSNVVAGAFVNCWLFAADADAAVLQARQFIQNDGWIVGDPDDVATIDLAMFQPTEEARPFFEQVQHDGEVYDFNCFPIEEAAED